LIEANALPLSCTKYAAITFAFLSKKYRCLFRQHTLRATAWHEGQTFPVQSAVDEAVLVGGYRRMDSQFFSCVQKTWSVLRFCKTVTLPFDFYGE